MKPIMFGVMTQSGTEEKIVSKLNKMGVGSFCPTLITRKKVSRHSKRMVEVEVPAISGLVFAESNLVNFGIGTFHRSLNKCYGVLKFGKSVMEIPKEQVALFAAQCKALREGFDPDALGADMVSICVGDEVEIVGDLLSGLRGYVLEIEGSVAFIRSSAPFGPPKLRLGVSFLRKIGEN